MVHDENDNAPEFARPSYNVRISEDQGGFGKEILRVSATDADAGVNGQFHYSLADVNDGPFEIDPLSGVIRLSAPLDFERRSRFYLKVRVEDHGKVIRLSSTINVTVEVLNVNDNVPYIANTQLDAFIPTDTKQGWFPSICWILRCIIEVIQYVVDAADADHDAQLTYSLSGEDVRSFSIDRNGAIRKSTTMASKSDYSLTATVSDEGGQNASVSLRLYHSKGNNFPQFEVRIVARVASKLYISEKPEIAGDL